MVGAAALTVAIALLVINLNSGEKKIQRRIERLFTLDDPHFRHELGVLLGPPFVDGNRYELLRNGDEIFPVMLGAIRSATKTITFETYIYWSGQVGRDFADALAERSRAGVKVHVLLDWVGSAKMDQALLDEMRAAGVQMHRYHPPHWSKLGRMNNRTHRKLLVVDGRLGFTGGVGIAQLWTGNAQDPQHWRDSHFRVEGPVVAQMQSVFMDNWIKVSGDVLHGNAYFPALDALQPAGEGLAQMFSSSPSGGSESMQLMYLMAITAASRTIDLSAAYFVPDDLSTAREGARADQLLVRRTVVMQGRRGRRERLPSDGTMKLGIALDWAGVPPPIRRVGPKAAIELVLDRSPFDTLRSAAGSEVDADPPRDTCRDPETLALPQRCIVARWG